MEYEETENVQDCTSFRTIKILVTRIINGYLEQYFMLKFSHKTLATIKYLSSLS